MVDYEGEFKMPSQRWEKCEKCGDVDADCEEGVVRCLGCGHKWPDATCNVSRLMKRALARIGERSEPDYPDNGSFEGESSSPEPEPDDGSFEHCVCSDGSLAIGEILEYWIEEDEVVVVRRCVACRGVRLTRGEIFRRGLPSPRRTPLTLR